MRLGPKLFPTSVDTDDGSIHAPQVATFFTFDQATGDVTHVQVYDSTTTLILDSPVTAFLPGPAPAMMNGRHQVTLADGRLMYVLEEQGCGCGSRLKGFYPGVPATSGWRP